MELRTYKVLKNKDFDAQLSNALKWEQTADDTNLDWFLTRGLLHTGIVHE
jgi:hypothetical protein